MALTIAQRTRAASAYRTMLRASSSTFQGDPSTLSAFRLQARNLFDLIIPHRNPSTSSPEANNVKLASLNVELDGVFEAATYLRRNVVQAHRSEDGERMSLRFTKDTELGNNDSIRNPKAMPPEFTNDCGTTPVVLSEAAQTRRNQRKARRSALDQ